MATDRRKFLALMALGVPATARALRQDSTPAIPSRALIDEDGEYESAFLMELVPGVRQRLWDAFLGCDLSMRVVRNAPGDCPPGKIRWAIEVEESDGRSESVLNKHPNVLSVNGSKSLRALYTICLEQAGCMVESVPNNDAAMRLYREHGPYEIVLTHFFQFKELSKRIRERNPEQAIAILGANFSYLQEDFEALIPYGYEIDCGGFGDVILNVKARKITVERNDRFEDYTTSSYEV